MTLAIRHFGLLIPGNYAEDDPHAGLEAALQVFELAERLGYRSAWVRQRHLEHGVSSAPTFLAAASQRTSRIEIGSAVIQIGLESPFRLAEDLAMVDALSRGRLNIGLSAGPPQHLDLLGPLVFDGDWKSFDFSHERIARLVKCLGSEPLGEPIAIPGGKSVPRLQPRARGLVDRLWYGGGSLKSATWAGRNRFNLLLSNVTTGEGTDSFVEAQLNQIRTYRKSLPTGAKTRIAVGRVIIPTDSADAPTRARYARYAESRQARTLAPIGEKRTIFGNDLVGTAAEIVDKLLIDPVLGVVDELRLELPYEFRREEYEQILDDTIRLIGPVLQEPMAAAASVHRHRASR